MARQKRLDICWDDASFLLLFLLLSAPCGFAQLSTTGTLNGTVVDSSHAIVPGAAVEVMNADTGIRSKTLSNGDGSFVVPSLNVGTYTITVSKTGFQTYTLSGVALHPAIVTTVNVELTLGQVSTQVKVTASSVEVQTATSEVSSQVAGTQAQTLPLNGRNYEGLASLMPGVANTSPGNQIGQGGFSTNNVMSINGMGLSGSFYTVDGIWNENTGNMTQNSVTPNPDVIQEVRVLQNDYGVQYSLMGANVVMVQTKSGTDQFHGSGWEYFRNDALDARNFFSPTVPGLKQNIFGYTLGGPVYIPGHYNTGKQKTFFFWSQQFSRQNIAATTVGATPTAAMREGTFPTSIKNPATGQPFPLNSSGQYQIPSADINSSSLALLNALEPLPNNPAGGFDNFINLTPQLNRQRDDDLKIDQNFGERVRLMGEYVGEWANQLYPSAINIWPTTRENVIWPDYLVQLQLTANLSSSMVNTASISMNHRVVKLLEQGLVERTQVPGFQEVLPYDGGSGSDRLPTVNFAQGWTTMGLNYTLPYYGNSNLDATITDNWSWLHGKHYLLAGVNIENSLKRQEVHEQTNGTWSFSGQFTGSAIADYLLGDSASLLDFSSESRPNIFFPLYSPYVQDVWKATRRVTVTLGLRWMYEPAGHTFAGYDTNFVPADYSLAQAPIVNANGTITATANYNPLNGLVYNGINGVPLNFTTQHQYFWAPSLGFAWDVFGDGKTALRGGYGITYTHSLGYSCINNCAGNPPRVTSLTLVTPSFPNPTGAATKPAGASTLSAQDPGLQPPQVQTYSLSLEHQFRGNWFASIAGAGNIVRHTSGSWNINQPLPDAPYNYNPVINAGTVYAYTFSPYQGYAAIGDFNSAMNAYWDALEVNVRHPITQGLFLTVAYTWSHSLSEGSTSNFFGAAITNSIQNSYNPAADYGDSLINIPQLLSVSTIWTLPWYRQARGLTGAALGGWKFSDITTIETGFSLTPLLSTSTQGLATRPNATGTDIFYPKTVAKWFNTGAFSAPAAGYFGNAGVGTIGGPGMLNFDMAFYKDFHIRERHTIEFRAELFNIFNHANFTTVATTFGAANFGHVTGAADPRIAEFALRYQF